MDLMTIKGKINIADIIKDIEGGVKISSKEEREEEEADL